MDLIGYYCYDEISGSVFPSDIPRFFILSKLSALEPSRGDHFSVVCMKEYSQQGE